ncbi:tetratricopeptide repeat protein 32 [Takifugu rubripes]|uniref:Tetratricopeptide repeat domain 32 n=2 Tax=Takifugu TaxID=31032 RepID=A0A3B5K7K9_TAKRU|nr:tetratricopeptide repeat protein 32 [Takifugu rubripes]XP_056872753.1 tetratricopeptide repeat protein 32 isoform X2 [Takifugu flavidus]TWW68694.1 Tetratricopeptide repeat protein 32 [Takifugu flavidus]|eukprot:XP_003971907.1 PREDICTED: tetratricopeptide repeat protein 32 [Takifugu rubripes]
MAEDISHIFKNANSKFNEQNYEQAEELFTKYITSCLQSRDCEANKLATAYNNRGQIKYLRVDFSEATEDFTAAIATDSCFEIPLYNRGLIRYRLGFFDDAKSDFEQALKLKPDFEDAKVSLHQTIMDQQHKLTRGY